MPRKQGKQKIAARCFVCLVLYTVAYSAWASVNESPDNMTQEHSSVWKKTLGVLKSYSEVGEQLRSTQAANQRAIMHYRILNENLKMKVPQNLFQQMRGFRQYSNVHLSKKLSLTLDAVKANPLGPQETRILKNMAHFKTLQDSQREVDKGIGIEFNYQFD